MKAYQFIRIFHVTQQTEPQQSKNEQSQANLTQEPEIIEIKTNNLQAIKQALVIYTKQDLKEGINLGSLKDPRGVQQLMVFSSECIFFLLDSF